MSGKYLIARDAFGNGKLAWNTNVAAQLVSAECRFDERHENIEELSGAVGKPVLLRNPTMNDGWTRCEEINFTQVSGREVVAIVFFRDEDGMLIHYHDAVRRFPIQPNGGDIDVGLEGPGIFRL